MEPDNLPLIALPKYKDGTNIEEGTEAGVFCEQLGMATTTTTPRS